jgi:hypothetical protein
LVSSISPSSPTPSGMFTVASSAKACELRAEFEKSGAGGSGRRGLPPYLDEGVPGRGLPLRSAGSYDTFDVGGLEKSDLLEEGVHGRVGELSLPPKGTYVESGGGICGASPMIELALE